MADSDAVLIDSCIWVPFFNQAHSQEKRRVDELLDEDRAALIGPILAEAAVAMSRGAAVYTTDPHFDLIPKLRRYPTP